MNIQPCKSRPNLWTQPRRKDYEEFGRDRVNRRRQVYCPGAGHDGGIGVVCSIATLCFAALNIPYSLAFVVVAGNTINFRFVCQGNSAAKERESGFGGSNSAQLPANTVQT